jgi:hypothetical protein
MKTESVSFPLPLPPAGAPYRASGLGSMTFREAEAGPP